MGFRIAALWQAPEINPINAKALSIPVLNPINKYGRVFFFAWWGFMIAFWSWYAFPPLLTLTVKKDLKLSQTDIANSNILALVATLLVRAIAGPSCDKFGPRKTFAGCLVAGAIPTALAGAVYNVKGLLVLRFFIGILGGSFVPCQVWSTQWFDKKIVGTANALTGGWGNAGGGITYFLMPAIFDSLVHQQNLTPHVAWRVAFIVPFILITTTAIAMLLLCDDCPTGKWADRHLHVQQNLQAQGVDTQVVFIPGAITDKDLKSFTENPTSASGIDEKRLEEGSETSTAKHGSHDREAQLPLTEILAIARGEVVQKPSFKEAMEVTFSPQTFMIAFCYFCSFGSELAINSTLGAYYFKNFKSLGQAGSGRWAAMFGLLNVVFRPAGGIISDFLYRRTGSVWAKKILLHSLSIICGAFLIIIGALNSHESSTMFGLVAGMAFFLQASNGVNFSLVPHIHPHANGIVSGITGATGNFGGVIFAVIFRYNGANYGRVFWIIGVITIGVNVAVSWIRPIPKGQIGGR